MFYLRGTVAPLVFLVDCCKDVTSGLGIYPTGLGIEREGHRVFARRIQLACQLAHLDQDRRVCPVGGAVCYGFRISLQII